jgi:hypothetical protein
LSLPEFSPQEKGLQMASPIVPWIGGKRRLVDLLLSRFPPHRRYVEVFAGGAAVFFARNPADVEVLNDVNGDLVNLYRVVTHHLEEFVRQFKWALSSRQVFKWLQETRPETLTDVQRAARFFYLQQQSFGDHNPSDQSAANRRKPQHCPPAPGEWHLYRAVGLGGLYRQIRQAAHFVLFRPTVLGDRGLWRAVSMGAI